MNSVSLVDGHIDGQGLTDEQIIKTLRCCTKSKSNEDCKKLSCPFFDEDIDMCGTINSEEILMSNALYLINRLKAENENLNVELVGMRGACESYKIHYDNAQAEIERLRLQQSNLIADYKQIAINAMKKFAERLKATDMTDLVGEQYINGEIYGYFYSDAFTSKVDNLLKEMDGE